MTTPRLPLLCHPDALPPAGVGVTASATRTADGGLALDYRLHGDLAALDLPAADTALPLERLWAFTCLEAFVAAAGDVAYREFNFAPNGQWHRFAFSAYRQGVTPPPAPAPQRDLVRDADGLRLGVRLARLHAATWELPEQRKASARAALRDEITPVPLDERGHDTNRFRRVQEHVERI